MNKTAIRNFAVWARNKLIADASYHAGLLGITKNGISKALPQSTKDVEFYDIGTAEPYAIRDEEIKQRKSLVDAIRTKEKDSNYETAYNSLIEEVAYTWFNRLIAVRFMEVNDYLPEHVRVLSSESGKQEPDIVTTPFDAELLFAEGEQQKIIQMKNDNKLDEVFRILFIKQCRELSRILPRLFEGTNDYTELLLSLSFIDQEGVVYHLVNDIPEEDFNVEQGGQVEIIGWLYQYYNDEKKDEVININKSSIKKEDIPAATQLFTTDWVVRYIVDNSLGKYWIERNPTSNLKDSLEYLVISKVRSIESVQNAIDPEQIRVFDPCMGSGHFLVYAFEVLMKIYEENGYTKKDAASSIVENNLYGLDIDDRASQLAYFAIMMKARQYNRRILDGQIRCNVMSLAESVVIDDKGLERLGNAKCTAKKLLNDFNDAKEFGSIITPSVTYSELIELENSLQRIKEESGDNIIEILEEIQLRGVLTPLVEQAKMLVSKYHVVVTNPPYLNKFSPRLKKYVLSNYKDFAGDLFSVFIVKNLIFCAEDGYAGFMTPFVWMFIKKYEKLRGILINSKHIDSLIQMEYSAFEEATVPICSFVIKNSVSSRDGIYIRLSDFRGGMDVQKNKVLEAISASECKYWFERGQSDFAIIPGMPIDYWISSKEFNLFNRYKTMGDFFEIRGGMTTGNNEMFLRCWFEVCYGKIGYGLSNDEARNSMFKWFPYNKGGDFRKWYGNALFIINWYKDGNDIKEYKLNQRKENPNYNVAIAGLTSMFKPLISWSLVTAGNFGVRYYPKGFLYDVAGSSVVVSAETAEYVLAYLNSKIASRYLKAFNPTINYQPGDVKGLIYTEERKGEVEDLSRKTLSIAKEDWDSFEISWDFKKHPLI